MAGDKTILYVEDHVDTCALMQALLEPFGYDVKIAGKVAEAVRLARKSRFRLYVVDSWLPDGTGIEFCKAVRAFDQHTPILFISAVAQKSYQQEALAAGAHAYIVKPADLDEVLLQVSELIRQSEHAVPQMPEKVKQGRMVVAGKSRARPGRRGSEKRFAGHHAR